MYRKSYSWCWRWRTYVSWISSNPDSGECKPRYYGGIVTDNTLTHLHKLISLGPAVMAVLTTNNIGNCRSITRRQLLRLLHITIFHVSGWAMGIGIYIHRQSRGSSRGWIAISAGVQSDLFTCFSVSYNSKLGVWEEAFSYQFSRNIQILNYSQMQQLKINVNSGLASIN